MNSLTSSAAEPSYTRGQRATPAILGRDPMAVRSNELRHRRWRRSTFAAGLVLIGYFTLSRSFAYIGVPALNFFIGEALLAWFLIFRSRASLGRWAGSLIVRTNLSNIAWAIYVLLAYGLLQVARGISIGYEPLTAAQSFVFNYYPLFLFFGVWIGERDPAFLNRIVRSASWVHGFYGVAYILVFSRVPLALPWSPEIPLFGQPVGAAVLILGLLTLEGRWKEIRVPFLLNVFVLLGMQVRAEWLGFLLALAVWGILTRHVTRVAMGTSAICFVLLVGYVADVNLPSPSIRSEATSISTRDLLARAIAPFDRDIAENYTDAANVELYAGTAEWRTNWWKQIWRSVHSNTITTWIGHSYGYPLVDLFVATRGRDTRTPHSVFFYNLGYGGWMAVLIFTWLFTTLVRELWRTWKQTGQIFGILFLVVSLTMGLFGNFFETPYAAIPFYLVVGLNLGLGRSPRVHAGTKTLISERP